jgi:hypothetical protein
MAIDQAKLDEFPCRFVADWRVFAAPRRGRRGPPGHSTRRWPPPARPPRPSWPPAPGAQRALPDRVACAARPPAATSPTTCRRPLPPVRGAGLRPGRRDQPGVRARRLPARHLDHQGRAPDHRGHPHRRRLGWHRTRRPLAGHRAGSSAPATRPTWSSWIPPSTGSRPSCGPGRGSPTSAAATAPRRSCCQGLPAVEVRRLRLPRPLDEWARKAAAEAGVGDRSASRVARPTPTPARLRPGRRLRRPPRHGRPAGRGGPHPPLPAGDGTFLLVEPAAGERVEDNLNPVGRIFYSALAVHLRPQRRSQGGEGSAARSPRRPGGSVLAEAGFGRVRRATETPFNRVFEARP